MSLALVEQGALDQIDREVDPACASATTVFSNSCARAGAWTLASAIGWAQLKRRLEFIASRPPRARATLSRAALLHRGGDFVDRAICDRGGQLAD